MLVEHRSWFRRCCPGHLGQPIAHPTAVTRALATDPATGARAMRRPTAPVSRGSDKDISLLTLSADCRPCPGGAQDWRGAERAAGRLPAGELLVVERA